MIRGELRLAVVERDLKPWRSPSLARSPQADMGQWKGYKRNEDTELRRPKRDGRTDRLVVS